MKSDRAYSVRSIADGFGVLASTVCAVHCVIAPTLLVLGTAIPASLLEDEWFHRAMLWVILPAAILAFGLGCRRHRDRWVFVLGGLGLIGIVVAATVLHDVVGESGERVATLASAGLLVAAHVRNFKLCRTVQCDHGEGAAC